MLKAGLALVPRLRATDTLRINLSGTLPGGQNSLYAPNGISLRLLHPPTGDGITHAIAEGGGGGGFSLQRARSRSHRQPRPSRPMTTRRLIERRRQRDRSPPPPA